MKQRSLGSSLKSMLTNAAYKWDSYFCQQIKANESLYILGTECVDQEHFSQIKESLIWFTYRSEIKYENKLISDQGWGCLLRVAQMVFANALVRSAELHLTDETKRFVVALFEDNSPDAPFCIQEIMTRAKSEDYKIKVGDWYTGPKIMSILEDLNNHGILQHLRMPLRIVNFFEQCVLEEQLNFATAQLIVVHAMIADKELDPAQIKILKDYMQVPHFAGSIVGKSNKAYYLIGYQNDNAIYLDPHLVVACGKQLKGCELKCHPLSQLSGQIGLAYYVQDKKDYFQFKQHIREIINPIFSVIES